METLAPFSRLFSRPRSYDTIAFDSALKPEEVIRNLEARGREWRESSFPTAVRGYNINRLGVDVDDYQFAIKWSGPGRIFYNPTCQGTVQPYGNGSRIRAGFAVQVFDVLAMFTILAIGTMLVLARSPIQWLGALGAIVLLGRQFASGKTRAAVRASLVQELEKAAGRTV